MPRKFDTTIDPPMEWTVFKTIYDLRIKGKRHALGVVVDYALLMKKTGEKSGRLLSIS